MAPINQSPLALEAAKRRAELLKTTGQRTAIVPDQQLLRRQISAAEATTPVAGAEARAKAVIDSMKARLEPQAPRQAPVMATKENPLKVIGSTPSLPVVDIEKQLEDIAIKKAKNEPLSDEDNRLLFRESRKAMKAPVTPTASLDFKQMSPEQLSQMSPEQMQDWSMQQFQEQALQQKQLLEAQQAEANSIMQGRTGRLEEQLKGLNSGLSEQDQMRVNEFRAAQEAEAQKQAAKVRETGLEQQTNLLNSAARRGFSRSSATESILQKASQGVIDAVGEIEAATGKAVSDYQAKLLDKQDIERQKLQEKLDMAYNDFDNMKLTQLKEQHSLITDLMKQNPASPDNMIKLAEKLQTQRIEQAKLDAAEKKAVREDAIKNFQFMVGNFGSEYVSKMPPEVIANMAANMGVDPATLAKLPKTMKEQENEWEKLKYFDNQDFELNLAKMKEDADNTRMLANFDHDLAMNADKLNNDLAIEAFKNKLDSEKDTKKRNALATALGINYAGYADSGNKSSLSFSYPVPHPSSNSEVIELNPSLATAYPDNYRFKASDGAGGLGGQCKWFAQQLTQFPDGSSWLGGSSLQATKDSFNKYYKQGKAFKVGEQEVKPGMSVLSSDSKTYGHGYVINAIRPDGKWVVTESNYKGPLTVSNSRVVDPNDPNIIGVLKTVPKSKYQLAGDVLKGIGQGITEAPRDLGGAIGGAVAGLFGNGKSETPQQDQQTQGIQLDQNQIAAITALPSEQKQMLMEQMPEVYQAYVKAGGAGEKAQTTLQQQDTVLKLNNEVQEVLRKKTVLNEGVAFLNTYNPNSAEADSTYKDNQLVYAYMKVLDPNSVVKESEFNTAAKGQGIINELTTIYGKAQGKGILTPQARAKLVEVMNNNYMSKVGEIDNELKSKDYLIERMGLKPEDVYDVNFAYGNAFNRNQPSASGLLTQQDQDLWNNL